MRRGSLPGLARGRGVDKAQRRLRGIVTERTGDGFVVRSEHPLAHGKKPSNSTGIRPVQVKATCRPCKKGSPRHQRARAEHPFGCRLRRRAARHPRDRLEVPYLRAQPLGPPPLTDHPLPRVRSVKINQLHVEHERRAGRDQRLPSVLAVGKPVRDDQRSPRPLFHGQERLVPSLDHLAGSNLRAETRGAVERGPIEKPA